MLTDRQKMILKIIIDDYVQSAEPVGSRIIAKKESINYSSATIRNEMSDLEDLGYLEQPHTSAGRIPSQKGYRFYVDHLMEKTKISESDYLQVQQQLVQKKLEVEGIISNTANILADLTNYTAIVLGPEVFHARLKNIQLIPINAVNCVCILVTDTGHVEKKVVTIPTQLSASQLEKLTNILNSKLVGTPLYKLSQVLYSEVAKELQKNVDHFEHAMEFLQGMISEHQAKDNRDVFLRGTTHILNQPEFKDIEKVKSILALFERNGMVIDLFTNQTSSTEVKIGQENHLVEAHNCSIITANYVFDGQPIGTIGIIGPTRLDYSKVIAMINYVSKDLSKILNDRYKE